jgi:tRNA 2-thiouridine synthesizing protein A
MTTKTDKPESPKINSHLDLQGICCPLNYVKTKLALEALEEGQILEVILDQGEAMMNVPRSLKSDGHRVVSVENLGNGSFRVLIEKKD